MERPAKRQRISAPVKRSPRDPGSQMAEGLFTSETGIRSDETDISTPTRTMNLFDLQRRALFQSYIERRDAGVQIRPRAPDATVTANAVLVNVNEGSGTSTTTLIAVSAGQTVVSLSDVGSVTVPGISGTGVVGSISSNTQSIVSTSTPSDSASSSLISTTSLGLNGTSSTSERTVTVTTTSTLDLSVVNGTIFVMTQTSKGSHTSPSETDSGSETDTSSAIPTGIGVSYQSTSSPTSTYDPGATTQAATPGAGSSASAASPTSSHSSSGGGGGGGLSPAQQTVVGGVVGGVAGVALVLVAILIFLRWYRRRLKARGELPEQVAQRQLPPGPRHTHTMSERSSGVPLVATLRNSLGKWRPSSAYTQATTGTVASAPESDRGFQRIAGRKIAPVLGTGSDPYGGNYGAFEKETAAGQSRNQAHTRNERSLAGSSFYRDSGGFYGGRGDSSPVYPPSPTIGTAVSGDPGPSVRDFGEKGQDDDVHPSQISLPSSKPEGMAALRPSPARTPVTISPASSNFKLPIQQAPPTMEGAPPVPPIAPGLRVPRQKSNDPIGRTLASQDGSHVSGRSVRSRFSESIS